MSPLCSGHPGRWTAQAYQRASGGSTDDFPIDRIDRNKVLEASSMPPTLLRPTDNYVSARRLAPVVRHV